MCLPATLEAVLTVAPALYNPGALELMAAARAAGLKPFWRSRRLTFFADRVKAGLGMDFARANQLEVQDGHLTGRPDRTVLGKHLRR